MASPRVETSSLQLGEGSVALVGVARRRFGGFLRRDVLQSSSPLGRMSLSGGCAGIWSRSEVAEGRITGSAIRVVAREERRD
jgi:hypothetical protein